MLCKSCQSIISDNEVILSQGKWSKEKHFARVCQYALKRNKPCLNDKRTLDYMLTWKYQETTDRKLSSEIQNIIKTISKDS